MSNEKKKWEEYLGNIVVTNLRDTNEIASKIIEVENKNPEYGAKIMESLHEVLEEENNEQ